MHRSCLRTCVVLSVVVHLVTCLPAEPPVRAAGPRCIGVCPCQKAASARFVVYSYMGGPRAKEVLDECERLYQEIRRYWFGRTPDEPWAGPCHVVLHADRASYGRAVAQGDGTVGRSSIRVVGGRIVSRRIDLLVDEPGRPTALAHELTHILLADHWSSGPPPRWLDEGVALCADSPVKQNLHWRDCRAAAMQGTAIGLKRLLTADQLARDEHPVVFYGQSLALVAYLLEQGPPEKVLAFAGRASVVGYDRALRECYGIQGVADLERRWHQYLADTSHGGRRAALATNLYE